MRSSNLRTAAYVATTALSGLALGAGAVSQLSGAPEVVATLTALGYPTYLGTLLGVWKALFVVAIVAPRFPRLKEWAYAGMFFNLTGAAFSHALVGDGAGATLTPLLVLGVVMASWSLRPASRRLPAPSAEPASERVAPTAALARS
jgi:hypothetical protein